MKDRIVAVLRDEFSAFELREMLNWSEVEWSEILLEAAEDITPGDFMELEEANQ